jgi:hypothetical protein
MNTNLHITHYYKFKFKKIEKKKKKEKKLFAISSTRTHTHTHTHMAAEKAPQKEKVALQFDPPTIRVLYRDDASGKVSICSISGSTLDDRY